MGEQKKEEPKPVEMKKTLSTTNIVSLSLAFIGPAAYGVGFLQIVAVTIPGIGMAIALGPIMGVVACVFTAVSVAVLAIKYAYSGGIYSYTREAMGPAIAFMAGWTILLPYLLLPAAGALFIGVYMPVLTGLAGLNFAYDGLVWALVFGAIMTVMAFIGIKTSARSMTIVLLIQIALIFAIAVGALILAAGIPGTNWIAPLNPAMTLPPMNIAAIAAAGFTFFFAFYGFEATVTFGGDAKNPYKSCALGALMAIAIVGTLYVFLGWSYSVPYTSSWDAWNTFVTRLATAGDMSPVAQDVFGVAGVAMLAVAIIISALGSGIAATCSVSRILWQMGADRLLPKSLEKLHPKYSSPYIAALAVGAVTALVPIIYVLVGYTLLNAFIFLSLWCAWGALLMYMFVNIDNILIFRHESTKSAKALLLKLLLPIIGFAIMAYIFYGSSIATVLVGPWPVPVLIMGIVWEIPGIIWLVYLYMKKPDIVKIGIRGV